MTDLFEPIVATRVGFRLHRLEVYNWGTFDSASGVTRGHVYRVEPAGQTTLLIGQNGSGKSTLVDALLTLLVRPAVRNYNVAAGAKKRERDERTYIKGAFDRRSRNEDNRADVQFLRPEGTHYSVLLACFKNETTNAAFTVAQVLYLNSEGRTEKVYCFAPAEKSIAGDCAGFRSMEKLQRQLRERDFRATKNYTEYHEWFRKATGVQPKAMDMLNQTVAVKDIERLNDFIRDHMLEPSLREDDINKLLTHYDQLNEAHQSLVRVRQQARLLEPIEERGAEWRRHAERLDDVQQLIHASDAFFCLKTIDIFEPECDARRAELDRVRERKSTLADSIAEVRDECRRLRNQIEQAGGDRLREIPLLIKSERSESARKRADNLRFHQALEAAGIDVPVGSQADITALHERLPALRAEIERRSAELKSTHEQRVIQRGDARRSRNEMQEELTALEQRRENLPRGLAELRRNLCDELGLAADDLRFAAELTSVRPDEHAWEASIEMVLRGFALSLLVPDRHYRLVSSYVDRTRLRNARGDGQRLVYLRVGQRMKPDDGSVPEADSLFRKLRFRDGHPLLPWLEAELRERFDYRCCETIEEFQLASGLAVTKQRHVKSGNVRHSKDDRERAADPRHFVLGWDNREKRRRLAEEVTRLGEQVQQLDAQIARIEDGLSACRTKLDAIAQLAPVSDFANIDFHAHDRAIAELELERKKLEEGSEEIQLLKKRLAERAAHETALSLQRDEIGIREGELKTELHQSEQLVANAHRQLGQLEAHTDFPQHARCFDRLAAEFAAEPLSANDFFDRSDAFRKSQLAARDRLQQELEPLQEAVVRLMGRFLAKFPDERADLGPSVRYLDSFIGLLTAIREEDLPRHEERFKERLNDKVTREVGRLNGELQLERSSIEEKIELLNDALRQLEYRPGTHMRLEAKLVRDREIADFHQALASCLDESFEGSFEADEARFLRIKELITRLREEDRWRNKVTDVRRWFDFAAREIDNETGAERSYYEDSTGQSGGEKAKLAFTILVAAIAYQYDIDPTRDSSERFHFVVVDEMFSKVDDQYSEYALKLFQRFGLQLLIVAPLDAKARVTDGYVNCYLLVTKDEESRSQIHSMTAREFEEQLGEGRVETEMETSVGQ